MDFPYMIGFTIGLSDSTTKADKLTMTEAMRFEMTIGIPDEEGITEKFSMSEAYKHAVIQSATRTMTTTRPTITKTSCTPNDTKGGV